MWTILSFPQSHYQIDDLECWPQESRPGFRWPPDHRTFSVRRMFLSDVRMNPHWSFIPNPKKEIWTWEPYIHFDSVSPENSSANKLTSNNSRLLTDSKCGSICEWFHKVLPRNPQGISGQTWITQQLVILVKLSSSPNNFMFFSLPFQGSFHLSFTVLLLYRCLIHI